MYIKLCSMCFAIGNCENMRVTPFTSAPKGITAFSFKCLLPGRDKPGSASLAERRIPLCYFAFHNFFLSHIQHARPN